MPPAVHVEGQLYDFQNITNLEKFETPGFSKAIYSIQLDRLWEDRATGSVLDEKGTPTEKSLKLYQWSLFRLLKLQATLSEEFVGCDEQIRMLLACAIAQEPVLFVGQPGVAKTELAVSFFGGVGLRKPFAQAGQANQANGATNKYFEYLLSPFTVPEELFGPLDLKKLEAGDVSRINTNMVTGKMVRGVFLDEIFNASSSILNTLLTLINERRFFDRGMFQDADLRVFIGASNHTPASKYGSGDGFGSSKSGELEAFYDRFTVRLYFPTPQELYPSQPMEVMRAYEQISQISRDRFMEKLTQERPSAFPQMACLNDILLLGRILGKIPFAQDLMELKNYTVTGLAVNRPGRDLCLMSPRKPNKLDPIILADSLLLNIDEKRKLTTEKIIGHTTTVPQVRKANLCAFYHIWNHQADREKLRQEVDVLLGM